MSVGKDAWQNLAQAWRDFNEAMQTATLTRAAEECEWCELVLGGSPDIEPARTPDGLVWIHDDGNGEQIICQAADFWQELWEGGADNDDFSLREAAVAVATQIEQAYDVGCTLVWNNADANKLGFRLGAHTVGFLLRTYYSDGSDFVTLVPLAKAALKTPSTWPILLESAGKVWIAALQNEQERMAATGSAGPRPEGAPDDKLRS